MGIVTADITKRVGRSGWSASVESRSPGWQPCRTNIGGSTLAWAVWEVLDLAVKGGHRVVSLKIKGKECDAARVAWELRRFKVGGLAYMLPGMLGTLALGAAADKVKTVYVLGFWSADTAGGRVLWSYNSDCGVLLKPITDESAARLLALMGSGKCAQPVRCKKSTGAARGSVEYETEYTRVRGI